MCVITALCAHTMSHSAQILLEKELWTLWSIYMPIVPIGIWQNKGKTLKER